MAVGLDRAELQEGESLVHDALGERHVHVLVLDDTARQPGPELVADEALVGQLDAGPGLGEGHGHDRGPFLIDE